MKCEKGLISSRRERDGGKELEEEEGKLVAGWKVAWFL